MVVFLDHGFEIFTARTCLHSILAISVRQLSFPTISVPQRARNSVCVSHSDVWVEVLYLFAFSMISLCHSVIIVALIFMIASLCKTFADASILFYM